MKRLITLLMGVVVSVIGYATTVSVTISDFATQNSWVQSSGSDVTCYTSFAMDDVVTISTSGEANCGSFWGSDWRLYQAKNGNVIVTLADGYKLNSVTFTYNYSNTGTLIDSESNVVASGTKYETTATTLTLTVGNTNSSTTNGQVKIKSIEVVYESTDPSAVSVAEPTFSLEAGSYYVSQSTELSQTDGKDIYYTTDGTNPTTSTTAVKYTGAIAIDETMTIKAAATDGSVWSGVVSNTYAIAKEYASFEDLEEAVTKTSFPAIINFNDVIVTGVSGSNAYLVDNNGYGAVLYQSGNGFEVGDKISGKVNAAFLLYNGMTEITGVTSSTEGITIEKGATVTVSETTIDALAVKDQSSVVTISGLKYKSTSTGTKVSYVLTDGTNDVTIYPTFMTLPTFESGYTYTVTGVYIIYNTTKELAPRSEADIVAVASEEEEEETEQTSIANTLETAYTVEEATALIEAGNSLTDTVYVKGIAYSISISTSYGNATYYISDDGTNASASIQVFRGYNLGNEKFTSTDDITEGDSVVVYGVLQDYNGTKEISSGNYIVKTNHVAVVPTVDISNTLETAYTVTEARQLIEAGEGLSVSVYVTGVVYSIIELSTSYGNATYLISVDGTNATDTIEVYRGKYLDNTSIANDNDIEVGDRVVVYGQLVDYKGTYEFTSGNYIVAIEKSADALPSITIDYNDDNAYYNLMGQKVTKDAKGIIIHNGKKYLNR